MELPFNSEQFIDVWNDWIEYKYLEFKFKYKSPQSMRASLNKLYRLSDGDEQNTIQLKISKPVNLYQTLNLMRKRSTKIHYIILLFES